MGRLQDDIKVAKTAFEEDVKTQTMDIAHLKDALLEVQNSFSNLAKSLLKVTFVIFSLDKLKPKTKTKNQFFLVITFRLCYTL